MRILFISRWYPYPADNGSKIRVYNLIRELARTNEIWLASFAEEEITAERLAGMRALCKRVEVAQYRRFQPNGAQALAGFFANKPRSVVDTFSDAMKQHVERMATETQFDCVVASQIDMALYPLLVKGVPRILEEIEISIFAEQARRAQGPLNKMRKQLMWTKWRTYMRDVLAQYDGCTVVSQPEIAPIQSALSGYDRIGVIPNGADLERFTGNFGRPDRDTLVYTGALTYYVNFDAMKFFVAEVLPKVQAKVPTVKLLMAGRTDGVPINDLPQNPAAIHAGYRKDIRPFVASGWASVVPERLGGGTRIKVLESMALGTPVVSTNWGVQGLELQNGSDALFTDDPSELAAQIVRVLRDPALRESLRQNARQTVEAKYDWRVIGRQFEAFIDQRLSQR